MEENKEKGRRNSKNATQIPKQNNPISKSKAGEGLHISNSCASETKYFGFPCQNSFPEM